jgi:hypothetical protein
MPDAPVPLPPRRSVFDRIRGVFVLLLFAIGGFALYYSLFFERKTTYFSNRNARLIAALGDQIRRSIDLTGRIAGNATAMKEEEIKDLYQFKRGLTDRPPQAIFDKIEVLETDKKPARSSFARRISDTLTVTFEQPGTQYTQGTFDLKAKQQETQKREEKFKYAHAEVELKRLLDPMVRQAATEVFNTVFILDRSGNVIYQWAKQRTDDSDAELKIVRLSELEVSRFFEGDVKVGASQLMSASRQMAMRIGDRKYRVFSVPIRSNVEIRNDSQPEKAVATDAEKAEQKALAGIPTDLWVVCGAVGSDEFRAQSLALSATLLCCIGAAVLLMVCSWPFLKMALSSAQQKITLVDVILLGTGAVLGMSVMTLVALDAFTYLELEAIADGQLETFSRKIEENFGKEVDATLASLARVQGWAEKRIASGPVDTRNTRLLKQFRPGSLSFQSVALLGNDGKDDRQRLKWVVDNTATPLIPVASRNYYFAPRSDGREYLMWNNDPKERVVIESVRSLTTGQPEVVFARKTEFSDPAMREVLPVIAMTATPISIINPIAPDGFGFAIIDDVGTVLFHSLSARNTVENFFAETDEDPRVRSAVAARQSETIDIRYLGEDYTAHVRPMKQPPWTLITFRQKQRLRMINTEALMIALICLFAVLLTFIAFVGFALLLRPRYRADWLWPDPKRVAAYGELAAAYLCLFAAALVLLLNLGGGALLLFPFPFVPLVLVVTYLYLRPKLRGAKWSFFAGVDLICVALLIVLMWRAAPLAVLPNIAASILLMLVGVRAIVRRTDPKRTIPGREKQTALPLRYLWAAFLLLLLTSAVPAAAFFKAAYQLEMDSYVKWVQMKLAGDLNLRWWRIKAEFNKDRGEGKEGYLDARWRDLSDIYSQGVFDTRVTLLTETAAKAERNRRIELRPVFPEFLEPVLPHYSEASVDTRELVQDETADQLWRWTREDPKLILSMRTRVTEKPFVIDSEVPQLLPTMENMLVSPSPAALGALALLALCGIAFAVARFIARRIFLVDLVQPLALTEGYVGLRHVICHPCDDDSARRLFREFKQIDLSTEEGRALAVTAPQSFDSFEAAVFIDGVGHSFADGEPSKMLRALIDRLTRNSDRTVVIRPTALTVITRSFLQGTDAADWRGALAPFVWVNWSQVITTANRITLSGPMPAYVDDDEDPGKKSRWRTLYALAGFDTYFEQFTDPRGAINRTIKEETDGDPYLETMVTGWTADATGRDQVLDEIGERAEEYYSALWYTCSSYEQFVLMQLAQTGLVNFKARRHVRRLLARGHIRRDPQLRLMNETFRRFVLAQSATSNLAAELETNLAGDAWNRFRVPLFASIAIVLLFFFMTQRQMFDSTIALVTGLAASLPAFISMVSRFGNRSSSS